MKTSPSSVLSKVSAGAPKSVASPSWMPSKTGTTSHEQLS